MQNKEILKLIKLNASLLELHNENEFKVRSYSSAAYTLDKINIQLSSLSLPELEKLQGVGKSIASKIFEISKNNTFSELQDLLANTPPEVVEMLDIKGIGPKKVRLIWKELEIVTIEQLVVACKDGRIAKLKGFGDKLQEEILEFLEFKAASKGKNYYGDVESTALELEVVLKERLKTEKVSVTGEIRRKLEVVEVLQYVVGTNLHGEATLAEQKLKLKLSCILKVNLLRNVTFIHAAKGILQAKLRMECHYSAF
jgi:DNA polymerase (family 10)